MAILPVFFVWVGFSLCNFSVYRNVIIHWFRILFYFFPPLLVNHIHTLHCYGNWGSCKARIWWRDSSHLSSLRAWSKPLQHSLDQAEGICLHWVSKKSKFPLDKCTPALSTGRWNWQSSPICWAPTQQSLKSIVRLWPSLTNNRETLCESLSSDVSIPDFGRAR